MCNDDHNSCTGSQYRYSTGTCFIGLVNIDYVSFVDVTVISSTDKVAYICTYKLNIHLRYEANL